MKRVELLSSALRSNVCVFCAARLRLRPQSEVAPRRDTQRRQLQKSRPVAKPWATEAGDKKEGEAQTRNNKPNGGWGAFASAGASANSARWKSANNTPPASSGPDASKSRSHGQAAASVGTQRAQSRYGESLSNNTVEYRPPPAVQLNRSDGLGWPPRAPASRTLPDATEIQNARQPGVWPPRSPSSRSPQHVATDAHAGQPLVWPPRRQEIPTQSDTLQGRGASSGGTSPTWANRNEFQKPIERDMSSNWGQLPRRTPVEPIQDQQPWRPLAFGRPEPDNRTRQSQAASGQFIGFQKTPTQYCSKCGETGHTSPNCPLQLRPLIRTVGSGSFDRPLVREVGSARRSKPDADRTDLFDSAFPKKAEKRLSSTRNSKPAQNGARDAFSDAFSDEFSDAFTDALPTMPAKATGSNSNWETPMSMPTFDSSLSAPAFDTPSIDASRKLKRREDKPQRRDELDEKGRKKGMNVLYAREAAMDAVEAKARAERRLQKEARRREANAAKAKEPPKLKIPAFISFSQLATLLNVRFEKFKPVVKRLGFENVNHSQVLNGENAGIIAMEYGFDPVIDDSDGDLHAAPEPEDMSALPSRPPVVTIMGHVDHGKTTILDYLRKSSVAATEHGGITQHIGAFSVPLASGNTITFLDTPGHAAFLDMRQRGAIVTDIIVLVVAADDSVMPQTIEAIKHAKEAGVPMIVAINKMDKEEANADRVKQELARHGVQVEDFGGETQAVHVSGKTGLGMDDLEEAIVTLSEILDHRADPTANVEGWVLEGTKKRSGKSATVLVRKGTLRKGSVIVAGTTWARVRTMKNEAGVLITEVTPGMPALIEGWRAQPVAGDEVLQAPTEQKASDTVAYRKARADQAKLAEELDAANEARLADRERRAAAIAAAARIKAGQEPELPQEKPEVVKGPVNVVFIVKADVTGSVEAVINTITSIGNSEVRPNILQSGVGAVSPSDVEFAAIADGTVIAFNTTTDPSTRRLAEERGVRIVERSIIYRIEEDVKSVMSERLPPLVKQKVNGEAEILALFNINIKGRKYMKIAGSKVTNGTVTMNSKVKVLRGGAKNVVYDGTIASLKHLKKEVTEIAKGTECGIGFGSWEGFEVGDQIQCYTEWNEKRSL